MISSVLARRYARALVEIGTETRTLPTIVRDIAAVAEVYAGSEELRRALEDPQVPAAARKAVLLDIATRLGASPTVHNTLALLADHRRVQILPALATALAEASDTLAGVLRARIVSATPLSETYVRRLTEALEARFQKRISVQREVDPTLIGGVVTRVGDVVIDGSLKTRLADLKAQLQSA